MTITVITAPETNLLTTLANVKLYMGLDDTVEYDAILDNVLQYVTAQIESYTGRQFGLQTIKETLPGNGRANMVLTGYPIRSITHVKYDGSTVDADEYVLQEPDKGFLYCENNWRYTAQKFSYEVQYQFGYVLPGFATGTRNLPYDLEMACIDLVNDCMDKREVASNIESESVPQVYSVKYKTDANGAMSMPASVKAVLDRYRVPNL